jgi:type III pantothenate kinase
MLLAIDVGNTNTVFAMSDGKRIQSQWRLATNPHRTADEYGMWLRQLLRETMDNALVTDVILATVVPQTQFELQQCCRRYFKIEPLLVDSTMKTGIMIDVDHPDEVGADRVVNALQGWHLFHSGMVIVDFGTATTFDVVSGEGSYIGGVIAPGVNLSLAALHHAAAKLPSIRIRAPQTVIGRNTVAAMESGIYYGYSSMIEGMLKRICHERTDIKKIIATGGLAPLYAKSIPMIDEIIEDLTIDGLITLYALNHRSVI